MIKEDSKLLLGWQSLDQPRFEFCFIVLSQACIFLWIWALSALFLDSRVF